MELRIGVIHSPKELSVELDADVDAVVAQIDQTLAAGGGIVWFTDTKGRRIGAPAAKIAYIEISEDGSSKRVGFGR